MSKWSPLLLSALFIAAPCPVAAEVGPWVFVRDEQGVVVQKRKVEGSSLAEFQGRGLVEATPARIIAVIRDSPRRTEWMEKCIGSHSVEEIDDRVQISYNRTKASWPVKDRDVVLRGTVRFEPAEHRIRITFESTEHPKQPAVDGVVRMPFLRGHWLLTPQPDGKSTHVEYQVHANPGGLLPTWIANLVAKQLPWKTLLHLREQTAKATYPEVERRLAALPEYQAALAR